MATTLLVMHNGYLNDSFCMTNLNKKARICFCLGNSYFIFNN